MPEALITVSNLSYHYELPGGGVIPALAGISLTLHSGEYLGVVGHNGSGKSTLAKCLNGLLLPSEGNVQVLGMDTREGQRQRQIRAAVGLVLQNPDNQFVGTVVEEEVAFGAENLGVQAPALRQQVDAALTATNLLHVRYANPHTLSAGEKTRLAIAGILAMGPRCIILDESTAMLDPVGRAGLLGLLRNLNQSGLSIVTITHYMAEVIDADRVAVLDAGKLVALGTPHQVFQQAEKLATIGLDLPPVGQLAYGLAARGMQLGMPLTVQGLLLARREVARA